MDILVAARDHLLQLRDLVPERGDFVLESTLTPPRFLLRNLALHRFRNFLVPMPSVAVL